MLTPRQEYWEILIFFKYPRRSSVKYAFWVARCSCVRQCGTLCDEPIPGVCPTATARCRPPATPCARRGKGSSRSYGADDAAPGRMTGSLRCCSCDAAPSSVCFPPFECSKPMCGLGPVHLQRMTGRSRIAAILAGRLRSNPNGSSGGRGEAASCPGDLQLRAGRQEICRQASGLQGYLF